MVPFKVCISVYHSHKNLIIILIFVSCNIIRAKEVCILTFIIFSSIEKRLRLRGVMIRIYNIYIYTRDDKVDFFPLDKRDEFDYFFSLFFARRDLKNDDDALA